MVTNRYGAVHGNLKGWTAENGMWHDGGMSDETKQTTTRLTKLGERLAALPVHPRIGRMLLAGADAGLLREAATLAALLSEKDILKEGYQARRREAAVEADSDLLQRLDIIENHRSSPDLDPAALRAVERLRDELIRIMKSGRQE
jgi:ATP-dependent helicase HrpB